MSSAILILFFCSFVIGVFISQSYIFPTFKENEEVVPVALLDLGVGLAVDGLPCLDGESLTDLTNVFEISGNPIDTDINHRTDRGYLWMMMAGLS